MGNEAEQLSEAQQEVHLWTVQKINKLEWPTHIQMLCKLLMLKKPSNVAKLKQFCKENWTKIPPQQCHCQLLHMLKSSCCCQGWHNQGENYFFAQGQI